ncbi:gliding motility-associated ABC transporter permease subunit GldF [Fulvivirgaceae bacterium BMA10]|uniref:Gliding motility-associated ABC transporter permease subunit GldF n=1 Tax=Splendidivirga corallicola TaxID=3051826 RepID=A0ABT8KQ76_9BACT|nr:gliding motility-associated ABC transporter permease subunit GldF [Fulvivirgaceae bacterium BMA10]
MLQILIKEVNSFLNSLIAYIVICVFLTGIGLLMWVFPDTNVLDYEFADMDTLFSLGPYVFLFLIPAITMRLFSEEKKSGTLELLLTRPLTDMQIILGKYFSGLLVVIFALIPTVIYYFTLYKLGSPEGNIDSAGVIGSYIGLILLGALFTSIGVFSSAITENQIIAFIIAVFLCFFLYVGFDSIASIDIWGGSAVMLEQLGIIYHYNALSRGLVDLRDVVYFISMIALMLLLTNLILGSRKW